MTDSQTRADRLRTALRSISDCYDDTLEPARRATGAHVLTSLVNPPLPISAATLDTRAKAHERLGYWSMIVMRGRNLGRLLVVDVPALIAFLLIHVDYLSDYPRALADLELSAADLSQIAAQNAPHRFVVAECAVVDCAGLLRVTLRRDDDAFPSEIKCTLDSAHKWSPSMWKYIARVG